MMHTPEEIRLAFDPIGFREEMERRRAEWQPLLDRLNKMPSRPAADSKFAKGGYIPRSEDRA